MKYSLRSLMTFAIRDLFWVTVVFVLVLGWVLDHLRQAKQAEILEASGLVFWKQAEYVGRKNEELQRKLDEVLNSKASHEITPKD